MALQKILVVTVKASATENVQELELPEVNRHLSEGFFVKSWQTSTNQVNEAVTLTILLEKLESKTAPGVKFGLDPK